MCCRHLEPTEVSGTARGRERQEKILLAMLDVAGGTTKLCAYEDIVVRAWKLFPEEFGLRGYADIYPDSSDLHKPLYGPLKRDGLVRSQSKKFALTQRGLEVAERLRAPAAGEGRVRVERHQKAELDRLSDRPAVHMTLSGQASELLDTDLYDFYAVTVRTPPGDFAGRVRTVDAAIDAALGADDPSVDKASLLAVAATRDNLREKFAEVLAARAAPREKARS
jgi:hypothetical protein